MDFTRKNRYINFQGMKINQHKLMISQPIDKHHILFKRIKTEQNTNLRARGTLLKKISIQFSKTTNCYTD